MKTLIILILLTNCCLINGIEIKGNNQESFDNVEALASIKAHIKSLKPMPEAKVNSIAMSIYKSSAAHKIDYKIMTAIIMVESSFSQSAVSSTGDISIVQINYKIWKPEAKRLKFELSEKRLKTDSDYAIDKMGRILKYLKKTYGKNDPLWYARYHSGTYKLKIGYANKVSYAFNSETIVSDKTSVLAAQ